VRGGELIEGLPVHQPLLNRFGLRAELFLLGRIRAVPGSRSASGLWAVPSAGVGEAIDLAAAIAAALAPFDIEAETHRFRPHVTLCRARRPRRVAAHAIEEAEHILVRAGDDATSVSVHGVTLFSSTLTPRGPVYEELSAMPLRSD
jgi:2'-5' RNA ligase